MSAAYKIGVVVPTIDGREDHLARCVATHCPTTRMVEWVLSVQANHPNCAEAWIPGVRRVLEHGVDYVLVTADDFEARGPYWLGAVQVCDAGDIACPILYNRDEQTRWESSVLDGEPLEPARCTRSPNLLSFSQARRVFGVLEWVFAEAEPMQYYGDFLIGDIAHRLGIGAVVAPGFTFSHWWAQVGRHDDAKNEADQVRYRRALELLESDREALPEKSW